MGSSPKGSSVHGIFQTRILEWVAISFSRGSSQPRDQTQVYRIAGKLFTIWATREARPSLAPTKGSRMYGRDFKAQSLWCSLLWSRKLNILGNRFSLSYSPLTISESALGKPKPVAMLHVIILSLAVFSLSLIPRLFFIISTDTRDPDW